MRSLTRRHEDTKGLSIVARVGVRRAVLNADGVPYPQPGAAPQVSRPPHISTLKGWRKRVPMRKAFSLDTVFVPYTWGVAPGWRCGAPSALTLPEFITESLIGGAG